MTDALTVRRRATQAKQMEKAIRKSGNTDPDKLEEKRFRLSQTEALIDLQINQIQAFKHKLDADQKLTPELKLRIDGDIVGLRIQQALIGGLGGIMDCLSLREYVETARGKKGYMRYSITGCMMDVALTDLASIKRTLKKIAGEKLAEKEKEPPAEEEEEDIDDAEVFDPAEAKKEKK